MQKPLGCCTGTLKEGSNLCLLRWNRKVQKGFLHLDRRYDSFWTLISAFGPGIRKRGAWEAAASRQPAMVTCRAAELRRELAPVEQGGLKESFPQPVWRFYDDVLLESYRAHF